MELKAGYKQTEVGVIPEEWGLESLGDLGNWLSGGTPSMSEESYWNGDVPWVSPKDMKVARLHDALDHVTEKALGNGTRLAPRGAVLMVVRGMILAHSFPVARAERPLAFNQDIKALVVRAGVESDFVLRWFQASELQLLSVVNEATHGTKRIPSEALFSHKVALPPLPEQRAIAAALSDVEALIEALDLVLTKKRDLKQAAMQRLLTGQHRLPGFHGKWEISIVGREFEIQLGKMLDSQKNVGIRKPYLGNRAVQWDRIDVSDLPTMAMSRTDLERFRLQQGDLLVCEGGEVGRAAIWEAPIPECYYQKALHRLRPLRGFNSRLMVALLRYWVDHGRLTNYVTQTSIAHLTREKLADVPMPVPRVEEQTAIATVLSDMDAEITALEARRDKTRALKQGMMQELLTGKTRLVDSGQLMMDS